MSSLNRRNLIKQLAIGSTVVSGLSSFTENESSQANESKLRNNINHSACRWCYNSIPIEEFCAAAKKIGLKGIDLVGPKDWPVLKKYGLYSSMCNGAEINLVDGFNDKQFHDTLVKNYTEYIPLMKKEGYKNVICFSGSRRGKDDETGLKNCAEGIKKILSVAEKNDVIVVMELLNSKVDHIDYQCDKSAWGVELVKMIGSDHFRLLYDIYHMQIDEGDVIRTIKDNHQYFVHYHTGGVPGRHEIDESQELYYPAIMKAILDTGFKGYVAQEFIPSSDNKDKQIAALTQAVKICDV
ncbi:MAG: sugar phosphate isomerase/epimerase [Chitinophagaceae bacterium]|nr:sugar phosphate isomerase/epimerase [Chitinophagaceae bacterium]